MPGETNREGATTVATAPGGQPGGRQYASQSTSDTRERIIDAAAAVFLEKGFTGTRVVDIARRAGFTSGALYGYFDSRAELLAEAVARSSSEMLTRLLFSAESEQTDGTAAPDARERDRDTAGAVPDPLAVLDAALDQITEPVTEADQMLLDGVALAHREPVAGDRLAAALGQFREELAREDRGGLSPGAADMVVVLVLGITAARALGLHDPPPDSLRVSLAECLAEHG